MADESSTPSPDPAAEEVDIPGPLTPPSEVNIVMVRLPLYLDQAEVQATHERLQAPMANRQVNPL